MKRLDLFPVTTRIETDKEAKQLTIGGCNLVVLAERYGTPLYLYDSATLKASLDRYRQALERHYPGPSGITYAGKAFLCIAIIRWAVRQGLILDCTGAGELAIAKAAAAPRPNLLVHGVNKSPLDLAAAVAQAGILVVDNMVELSRLETLYRERPDRFPELWLRVRPGLAVETHAYRQTGQEDSKFGFGPEEILKAVDRCQAVGMPLTGLHFHLGSHFHDPEPLGPALDTVLDLIEKLSRKNNWTPRYLCTGGGWGVAYHEDELPHPDVESYVAFIAEKLVKGCQEKGLPLPHLQLEPGRGLVALAGVALYRVGSIKQTPNRRWLMIDGGLADNPRPALYKARYSALPVCDPDRPISGPAWLGGPFCESGDVLIENLPLPDIQPGELIAVPVSGAYHLSMGSNYNGAFKPAVVWLENGTARLILRRETVEDLVRRDIGAE